MQPVIEDYDVADIKKMIDDLSYENCKIILTAKSILDNEDLIEKLGEPLSEIKKEEWMSAKYRLYTKPVDPKEAFSREEWDEAVSQLKKPTKNHFVPENVDTIVPKEQRQQKNESPKRIKIDERKKIDLFHLLDRVHLKPRTSINIILRLRQPEPRRDPDTGRPTTYLATPRDHAMFRVLKGCLKSVITEKVGYEAQLASIAYTF